MDRTVREYLPFIATENLMMEAVKRGGDRQALHEIIRTCSMAATARMKEGEPCDLLRRLAAEPAFGMTEAEMEAVLDPARSVPCYLRPLGKSRRSICKCPPRRTAVPKTGTAVRRWFT